MRYLTKSNPLTAAFIYLATIAEFAKPIKMVYIYIYIYIYIIIISLMLKMNVNDIDDLTEVQKSDLTDIQTCIKNEVSHFSRFDGQKSGRLKNLSP